MSFSNIDNNIEKVRKNIESAASECGRDKNEITLLAAVKYTDVDNINYIHKYCGINDIGENRVQQLLERYDQLDKTDLKIHFIGSLQTNKVKYIVDKVCMIHSVDSEKLADEIDKQCKKINKVMDVLIEINSGLEENKTGVAPEQAIDLAKFVTGLEYVKLRGFMTMAPKCDNADDYNKYFGESYSLSYYIWKNVLNREDKPIISMGMSGSYMQAIKNGSTIIRLGSTLFKE